ncbi:hypothetical protein BSZ35_14485 [Salinibacter sp. 10B]|nr:hypothetical protein BSZ35_14485 [Salinibacter sp. 10B]
MTKVVVETEEKTREEVAVWIVPRSSQRQGRTACRRSRILRSMRRDSVGRIRSKTWTFDPPVLVSKGGRFGENARGQGNPHYGIDLLADIGTEVHSMREGIVWARNESEDFGKYIIIQTDGGNLIIYAHLSKRTVEGGESLSTGELIGKTGVSGNACETDCSCGPAHLHLGVKEGNSWAGGTPKDPENYIGAEFDSDGEAISDNCSPVFKGG